MRLRPVACFLACVLVLSGAAQLRAELPKGLEEPCSTRDADLKYLNNQLKDQVAHGCKEQIKSSRDSCFGETEGAPEDFHIGGTVNSAEQSYKAHEQGMMKYIGHAKTCGTGADEVHRVCKEMYDGLGQALRDNEKTKQEYIDQYQRTSPSSPQSLQIHNQIQEVGQISRDLQTQRRATMDAATNSQRILRRLGKCYSNKALIYADARNQAGVVMASSQGSAEDLAAGTTGQPGANDPMTVTEARIREHSASATAEVASKHTGEVLEKTIGSNAASDMLKGGKKLAGLGAGNLVTLDAPTDYAGYAQTAAEVGAEYFISPKAALRVTGIGTFLTVALEPTPVSVCSEMFYDPVEAYRAGCSVYTPQSISANENAIATLTKN